MTLLQALLLGVVQGATEFLPISSSGHLVLVPWLLGWSFEPASAFLFDVLVQWGTLVAVLIYFREDLSRLIGAAVGALRQGRPFATADARLAWLLILASPGGTPRDPGQGACRGSVPEPIRGQPFPAWYGCPVGGE